MRALTFAVCLLLVGLAGCNDDKPGPGTGASGGRTSCDGVDKGGLQVANASNPVVALATSEGCIVAELFQDKAPITVANFLNYTDDGFYTDLLFHRIIEDFMVQTGGMGKDGQFKEPTHPMIKNEARTSGLKNAAYTLSMARQGAACQGCPDRPDTATNQFFINHKANTFLDATSSSAGYAAFGNVVQGRDVVDAIASTPVESYRAGLKCQQDSQPSCPVTDVDLFSVRVL